MRVIDEESAYFRLAAEQLEPAALYAALKHVLRV